MVKRKAISSSLRWSVFARDGFRCRYCGSQAGENGVELHADHIVSVADGGDNSFDNLATACNRCNGGKGARSLINVPQPKHVANRLMQRAKSIQKQAEAMQAQLAARKQLEQQAINLKCQAYDTDSCRFSRGEMSHIIKLCEAYESDNVLGWYRIACNARVSDMSSIRYVYGIIRNLKNQSVEAEHA